MLPAILALLSISLQGKYAAIKFQGTAVTEAGAQNMQAR